MAYDFIFLFEHTGYAAEPFTKRGYKTLIVDILNGEPNPMATETLNWDILAREDDLVELAKGAKLVFGMPPCTDLAVSGAKHFQLKYEADRSYQAKAAHLFMAPVRIASKAGVPFAIENPVSVMSRLWRKPDHLFHPSDYGGYLSPDDIHPDYPRYIVPQDAYPKLTCLWADKGFKMPAKRPVATLPGWNLQTKLLGGKSARTKKIRSASPRGFFEALAQEYHNGL